MKVEDVEEVGAQPLLRRTCASGFSRGRWVAACSDSATLASCVPSVKSLRHVGAQRRNYLLRESSRGHLPCPMIAHVWGRAQRRARATAQARSEVFDDLSRREVVSVVLEILLHRRSNCNKLGSKTARHLETDCEAQRLQDSDCTTISLGSCCEDFKTARFRNVLMLRAPSRLLDFQLRRDGGLKRECKTLTPLLAQLLSSNMRNSWPLVWHFFVRFWGRRLNTTLPETTYSRHIVL